MHSCSLGSYICGLNFEYYHKTLGTQTDVTFTIETGIWFCQNRLCSVKRDDDL